MRATGNGRNAGFTLVEALITMALLAFLLYLGAPAFGTMLQNSKLRSTAQTFLAGVQTARAEAIQRNANVDFVLTDDEPNAGMAGSANQTTTGPNWLIRVLDASTGLYTYIEGKSYVEGSGKAEGEAADVQISAGASTLTFNGLGRTSAASTVTVRFTNPAGGACAPTGPMRCLNVVVSTGGQARLCDPAVTDTADTRRC